MLKHKEDRQPKLGYTRAQCWPNVRHCVNVIQDTRLACGRVCTQSGRSIPFSPYRVNRFTFCLGRDMMLGSMRHTWPTVKIIRTRPTVKFVRLTPTPNNIFIMCALRVVVPFLS